MLPATVPMILILVAPFAITMMSRTVVVYGGSTFLIIFRVKIPVKWQNVLALGGIRGGMTVAISAEYEFKNLFISLIIPLITINLLVNPILLNQYLKKSKIT